MLKVFKRPQAPVAAADATPDPAPEAEPLRAAIAMISDRSGSLGREAAEVRGVIDEATQAAQRNNFV